MRATEQRSASLEQEARQPHLATEADVPTGTKAQRRIEDAEADQAKNGETCSTKRVQADPTNLTSIGMKAEPPVLPHRDGVLADKGTAAPKPCLSPGEMRTRIAAGGLLSTSKASTATMIIYYQLRLLFCPTKNISSGTSNQYTTDYSSFWKMEVLKTKSRQTLVFDPGGSIDRLHACPFLGTWRALLCGERFVRAPDGTRGWSVFGRRMTSEYHFPERGTSNSYVLRSIAVFSAVGLV